MAKSNWSGGAGWKAINDPTGLLTGRVLVATAGITQYAEDYLYQLVGTTDVFDKQHYAVVMNYAFPTYVDRTTFTGASLGLISRASALTTTTPTKSNDCYIGRISPKDGVAEIVRRKNDVEEIIASSILPTSTYSFGVLHTLRLNTFGTSPVTLQLEVDGETLVNVGDSTTSALTTGYSGIQMQGGTTYCDNYTVLEYTSSGGASYSGVYPNQFYDTAVGTTSTFLVMWLRGDVGITKTGDYVDSWADQAQTRLGGSYSLTQTGSNRPEAPTVATLNSIQYMRFEASKNNFLQGALNSGLDIQGSSPTYNNGVAVFMVVRFWETNGVVGDAENGTSGVNNSRADLGNYGRSYQFKMYNSITPGTTFDKEAQFDNNSSSNERGPAFAINTWGILEIVVGGSDGLLRGVYLNGTRVGTEFGLNPSNFDMADVGRVFNLGRRQFNASDVNYMYSNYDMAEYLLVQVASGGITESIRQKTEGYLAWKYDLVSLLPLSHPYKSAAPAS